MKSSQYNIDDRILAVAERLGLEPTATGGGCDFIVKGFEHGTLVLSSTAGPGESPDTEDEPSTVMAFHDSDWQEGTSIEFPTARQAMEFMSAATAVRKVN